MQCLSYTSYLLDILYLVLFHLLKMILSPLLGQDWNLKNMSLTQTNQHIIYKARKALVVKTDNNRGYLARAIRVRTLKWRPEE